MELRAGAGRGRAGRDRARLPCRDAGAARADASCRSRSTTGTGRAYRLPLSRAWSQTRARRCRRCSAEVAEALGDGEVRPVFVVGAGVGRDGAWDEVIALAERHEAPVWTAPMSARNGFPEDHRAVRRASWSPTREKIVAALDGHDLVLVLGAPAFTYHVEGDGPHVPEGARAVPARRRSGAGRLAARRARGGDEPQIGDRRSAGRPRPCLASGARAARAARAARSRDPARHHGCSIAIAALRPANSVIVEEAPSSREPMHDRPADHRARRLLHLRQRRPRPRPARRRSASRWRGPRRA